MYCRLIHDSAASGAWNMAMDESLLTTAAEEGLCTLRIYRWEEPTLSLGYFQEYADRRQHVLSAHCPCVRRASGGGAILHDREITYSFSVPPSEIWAKKHLALYDAFHAALVESLAAFSIQAAICQPAASQRDREQPFLCFLRRAPGDVLLGDAKIAGSAQRRSSGAVVQHGSILLEKSSSAPELPGLNDLKKPAVPEEILLNVWLDNLVKKLNFDLQPSAFSDIERRRATRLVEEKYGSDKWNHSRGR